MDLFDLIKSLDGEMYEWLCVEMGEQGGSFVTGTMLEEVGKWMEEGRRGEILESWILELSL